MAEARFITFEGIEGVGKSTQVTLVSRWLDQCGVAHRVTREPGGTAWGERIRELLLKPEKERLLPESELLLIFAARFQHLQEVVRPTLASGQWVLSDRFTDSSYAYQGGGRQVGMEYIKQLEVWLVDKVGPDLTVLLDASPEQVIGRLEGGRDRFESEALSFFERAREVYLSRARQEPERFLVLDATAPPETIAREICDRLQGWGVRPQWDDGFDHG